MQLPDLDHYGRAARGFRCVLSVAFDMHVIAAGGLPYNLLIFGPAVADWLVVLLSPSPSLALKHIAALPTRLSN